MPGTQASWPPSRRPTASTRPRRARPAPHTLDRVESKASAHTSTPRDVDSEVAFLCKEHTPSRVAARPPYTGVRPGPAPESTACAQPVHDLTRKPSTPSPRTQQGGLAHRDERGIVCPPSRGWKARVAASKRALRSSRARLPLEGQQQALHPLQLSGIDGRCSGEHAWPGAARTLELALRHKLIASTAPPPCHPSRAAEATGSLLSRARCPSRGGLCLRDSPVLCSSTCTRSRRRRRCGSHAPASPTTFSIRGRESSPPAHTAVRGPPSGPGPAAVRGDPSRSPGLNRWSPTQTLQPVAVEAQVLRFTTVEASSKSGCSRTDARLQASAQRSASWAQTQCELWCLPA